MAWLRRGNAVRRLAMVALIAVIPLALLWQTLGARASSDRLLAPIIEYHQAQCELNQVAWQGDLDRAHEDMDRTRSYFDTLTQLSDDATGLERNHDVGSPNASERMSNQRRSVVESIGQVGKQLRDASLHEDMTLYHSRMKSYYEGLLKDRVVSLPKLPLPLDTERRVIEAGLRWRYGESPRPDSDAASLLLRYRSEPPPHLAGRSSTP